MERLKKTRKALRAAFTRAFSQLNQFMEEENADIVEIQSRFEVFRGKVCELDEINQQIFQLMQDAEEITEEVLSEEIENADEYRIRYQKMKVRVSRMIEGPSQHTQLNESRNVALTLPHTQDKRFKLPKIELQKFGGDLKDWLKFWSLFKNIHEDESLSKGDKFQYLVQAIVDGSKASELINSFPPTAENYDKAIDRLRDRYGKSDLLIEVYVCELLKLVLNTVKVGNKMTIASLYDKLETQLRALESLNVTTEMCAAMLYPLVESALPEDLLRVWQRNSTSSGTSDAEDRLSGLMDFLQKEVAAEERIAMAVQGFDDKAVSKENKETKRKQKLQSNEVASAAGLMNAKPLQGVECIFCSEKHSSSLCSKAKTMSLEERQKTVRSKNACFNCLKLGHSFRRCRYKDSCPWCKGQHVLLMCRNISLNPKSREPDETQNKVQHKVEGQNLASLSKEPEVFLQTLRVCLINAGVELQVRAVIDTGSHYSYISERVAKKLRYEPIGKRTMIHLLFGGTQTQPQEHQYYNVHLRSLDGSYDYKFKAYQQDTICQNIPKVSEGPWIEELRHRSVTLSDYEHADDSISLLIGADIAGELYTGRIFNLKCGITAVETRLGWTLLGRTPRFRKQESDTVLTVLSMHARDADIADLWNLDIIGIEDRIRKSSKEDHLQEVLNRFHNTIGINKTGRYEVFLPWKENHPPLCENREIAERRLRNTITKLRNDGLLHEYEKVFNEWLEEGIIEEVPAEELSSPGHYLPHRHVVKENSTTRIRPVFDASAAEKGKFSLNQCLEAGPNFIELILMLLLRFREKRIGAIADIRRAFLQISVTPKERDYVRFFWQRISDNKIITYRHCRVVFGITSSPFLLGATLDYHLRQVLEQTIDEQEKSTIEKLRKSLYVDNCVTSMESEEEMSSFKATAIYVMSTGGFDLRGWELTSERDFLRETTVLGLTWDKQEDVLKLSRIALQQETPNRITKREILSSTQKVYDPLGFICPVTLYPKLLLRKLWEQNFDWDTEVELQIKEAFLQWLRDLGNLSQVKIPRWIFGTNESTLSLHLFVDASQEAYAAVIFVRVETKDKVDVHFVQAKNRVAPKKMTTIPRLELLAASIGARLMRFTLTTLENPQVETFYWTDSTTVLAWIQRRTQWATFVWNRVSEIRQLSDPNSWRHIPGNMNPADLPSRGCSVKKLLDSRWWEGPLWLYLPSEEWPHATIVADENLVASEIKRTAKQKSVVEDASLLTPIVIKASERMKKSELLDHLLTISSYIRIIRVLAWIKRFINNCRRKETLRVGTNLKTKEVIRAELILCKMVQSESFSGKTDPRLSTMRVFEDDLGLWRIRSLISNRIDTHDFRYPIILDSGHPIVVKLIEHKHQKLNHAQTNVVINNLREHFWILRCRRITNAIIRKCIVCKRYSDKKIEPLPAVLPYDRVKEAAIFEVTGIDYAGPLFLKDSSKAWICLFTCAIYRAVHLELVTSLSIYSFLEAFRRFIARRGRPSVIYTDNGTNFSGANKSLRKINWKKVEDYGTVEEIHWNFNPPTAAWWGGWWERLVRTTKELLRKILGRASLDYEELATVLCDCEAVINSRPITYLAEDPEQLLPLSPSLFLLDLKSNRAPDLDVLADAEYFNRRIRYRQELREDFG